MQVPRLLLTLAAVISAAPTNVDTTPIAQAISEAPALRVTLHAKRSSMAFHGQRTLTAYVQPRGSASANLEFNAWLSVPGPSTTAHYLIHDQRAYWFTTDAANATVDAGCLTQSQVPPLQLVQASLASSVAVKSAVQGGAAITCQDGQLLSFAFANDNFVACVSGSHRVTSVVGQNVDAAIEYLSDASVLPDWSARVAKLTDCPRLRASALESASVPTNVENGVASFFEASCKCKSTKRPCLFVHGVGETKSTPPSSSYEDTWGDIQDHAPCCSSVAFAHLEMLERPWTHPGLQKEFCDTARNVSGSANGKTIDNLIVTTFSMGNLVAAGALANGVCDFGKSVSWMSLAGPMRGSKTSNYLEKSCAACDPNNLANLIGYCPATEAYLAMKHETTVEKTLQDAFRAAQAARASRVTKTLCGISPKGLASFAGLALPLVSSLSGHDSPENDGVVDFPSCSVGLDPKTFGETYKAANYKASVNHLDSSFRNGDGWWGDDRAPIQWFECAL